MSSIERASRGARGRADLQKASDRPVDRLRAEGPRGGPLSAFGQVGSRRRGEKRGDEYKGGVCPTTTFSRRHPTPPRATSTPPNATFGSQMARFPRPYCATEPVRTVPFFNLYDDIQITQLGTFTDEFGTTLARFRQPFADPARWCVHAAEVKQGSRDLGVPAPPPAP